MSTRLKTNSKRNFGQSPLPSGYDGRDESPDLKIPSCGVEDVDIAMFNLFEKEISAQCGGIDSAPMKKVPVVFAAGEKWALLKRGKPVRDRNSTLILPLITIMRTDLNQNMGEDVVGRGINQQIGEIVVKRRLDKSDRGYQALINRMLIPNQASVADSVVTGSLTTDRKTGDLASSAEVKDGAYLTPNFMNNVYETIVVPMPQFYTVKYQVTVWTQYMQHANQIMEKVFSSLLPQGQSWRLDTPKGYWFVAKVEDGSFGVETNFEDMSQQERYIKHTFNVSVPAYFFVSSAPGLPIAVKRYVSNPIISFETNTDPVVSDTEQEAQKYVLGSDDPTLPISLQKNNRPDQRITKGRIYPVTNLDDPDVAENDPAAAATPRGYVKVRSTTSKGETVYTGASLGGLEIVVTK